MWRTLNISTPVTHSLPPRRKAVTLVWSTCPSRGRAIDPSKCGAGMKRAQTCRRGRAALDVGLRAGVAAGLLLALNAPAAEAQRRERGVSQQIRIVAHVKAFCRMGTAPHGSHGGMHLQGRSDDGRYIDRRLGGHGHFNVICNTPYALYFQRWGHGAPGWHDDDRRGPRDLRVDNADDLNVLLHFARHTNVLQSPCVLAATTADMSACLETAQPGEAVFPPSRTLVRLAVVGRPAGHIQPVSDVVLYPEGGMVPAAGEAGDLDQESSERGDYIALAVSGRY